MFLHGGALTLGGLLGPQSPFSHRLLNLLNTLNAATHQIYLVKFTNVFHIVQYNGQFSGLPLWPNRLLLWGHSLHWPPGHHPLLVFVLLTGNSFTAIFASGSSPRLLKVGTPQISSFLSAPNTHSPDDIMPSHKFNTMHISTATQFLSSPNLPH